MREIKFRAWVHNYIPSKEPASMVYSENVGGVGFFFNNFDGDETMQYTGLKDKNGVEIYEGDIVKSLGENDYTFGIREVIFYNGGFTVMGYGLIGSLVEVIGNIHQSPELLEK